MNARSIRNKRNLLKKITEEQEPDWTIITEHWLKLNENFVIDGFKTAAISRRTDTIGGGVMILLTSAIICDYKIN